jgi:hypothetical protein
MAMSRWLAPGVALFLGVALAGCNAPERNDDQEKVTTKRSALSTALFQPYVAYPTGSRAVAVAIGDLDGDSRKDVAVLTSFSYDPANDYMVHVFLQDADGTLKPRVRYSVGRRSNSIDIGDVNGDGRDDVVVGIDDNAADCVGILLQNATGTLDALVSYPTVNAYQVKVGDFNGDGRMDVAGLSFGSNGTGVAVLLQTETGTLAAPVNYPVPHGGFDELDAGDVNGDGRTDVVVMSGQTYAIPDVSVLLQASDGTLGTATSYSLSGDVTGRGIAVGDANGDGRDDVVISYGDSRPGSFIGRFLQNATGTLDPVVSNPTYDIPSAIVLADVDGDGRKDAVVTHNGRDRLGVHRQSPSGGFLSEEPSTVPFTGGGYETQGVAVGDISGDGRPDVVTANYNNGLVVLRQVQEPPLLLVITAPVNGPYYLGAPLSVRWVVGESAALVGFDLSASFNGGVTYAPIAGCTGLPATATECPWDLTGPTGSEVRVRVTARNGAGETASAESGFMFLTPSLTLSGGWTGTQYVSVSKIIGWIHNLPASDTVRIELSRDGGATYETLAAAAPITASGINGQFPWTITGPPTSAARLRVTSNGFPTASSSANFTISAPLTIPITAPTAGGVAYTTALTVNWLTAPGSTTYRIELSRDGGATFETIQAAWPSFEIGTFTGAVSGPGAADARVRVTANGSIPASGTSGSFTLVQPTVAVTGPAAGATLWTGTPLAITWSSNLPATWSAKVELSRNGGGTYETLAASVPNTGGFSGVVTGPVASAARVRVTVSGAGSTVATSGTFSIATPSLTVTGPAAGGSFFAGTPVPITWSTNLPASATALVELSRNGGSTYEVLAPAAANTGSFDWVATGPGTSAAIGRVTVTAGSASASATSAAFGITVPSLTATGPSPGASFYSGAPLSITWTSNLPASAAMRIELSRDGGGTFETLAVAAPNTGSFDWVVTGPDSANVRARVSVTDPVAMSSVTGAFSIATASVTVTGPAPGATYYTGMLVPFYWSNNLPDSATVRVELSRDGGSTYEVLAANLPNSAQFFGWNVAGPGTGAALARVTVTGAVSASATTASFAIVVPAIQVSSPRSGFTYFTGTPLAITWTTNLPSSAVRIELTRDHGETFETLAAAAPNTGRFDWVVTGPDSASASVRLTVADPINAAAMTGSFSIVTPSLTVTGPAAGTLAWAGTPVTITWTQNLADVDPVRIEVSRDGGATFEVIDAAAPNTGSYVWTASGPDAAEARVRVTSLGAVPASGVGAAFQIVNATLAVTSPAAGASWAIGTARTISWTGNLPAGTTVGVALSRDGGATWTSLASAAPASGSLAWTATAPATSTAVVRVTANGGVPATATSGAFAIGNPAVAVTSPAAGASWTIGTAQTITWTSNLLPSATVKIQVSRNGGGTYSNLTTSAPNTGSFAWTVTGGATTTAIVKVTANGFSTSAVSGTFSIAAASVTVTAPNTAVTWTIGTTQSITWNHNVGAGARFTIEVSRSGTWSVINSAVTASGATTGTYSWTVTGPKTTNAKVRVTWNGGTAKDTSDVAFKIN